MSSKEEAKRIITDAGPVSITDRYILAEIKPDQFIDENNVEAFLEAIKRLAGHKGMPMLSIIGKNTSASAEARRFAADPSNTSLISHHAVVIQSKAQELLGNFFIGMNEPKMPTRIFTNQEEAIQWLTDIQDQ
ncbi:MAG: STAS/SEC14 domain-containing protein [Flavobacteriales bacterium]|nr:STAS/SEC14 domain-containing protein [Flavobacteriales bacterium]